MSYAARLTLLLVVAPAFATAGCSGTDGSTEDGTPEGGAVTDEGSEAPEPFNLCPDPDDPDVHYVEVDVSRCEAVDLSCSDEQYGFHNACGCGCIDKGDPACPDLGGSGVRYHSRDPDECPERAVCQMNEIWFSNSCGCGCLQR